MIQKNSYIFLRVIGIYVPEYRYGRIKAISKSECDTYRGISLDLNLNFGRKLK